MRSLLFPAIALIFLGCQSSSSPSPAATNASMPTTLPATTASSVPTTGTAGGADAAPVTNVDPAIKGMFDDYAKAMTDYDLSRTVAFYAPTFILATPTGHQVVANDDARRQAVTSENAYYRDTLGMTSARILSYTQSSMANHHFLVHTVWGCTFKKTGDRVVEFPLSWVVEHIGESAPLILVHIVELDEPKVFHDLGLI